MSNYIVLILSCSFTLIVGIIISRIAHKLELEDDKCGKPYTDTIVEEKEPTLD